MVSAPALANVSAQVARPAPITGWVAHPAMVAPSSWNATVPVGIPDPGASTLSVAVNVTGCPLTDGSSEDPSNVDVDAGPTVCVRIDDVDPVKLRSPL